MTPIRIERLALRNWEERDRPLYHRINADDKVMEFFAQRRSRAESDEIFDKVRADIERNGFGWCAVEITDTGECIGFAGISRTDLAPLVPQGTIEIGWRLAPEFWGKGYATEAARAWLAHAFHVVGDLTVVSFAVTDNYRSIAVMERLGMRRDTTADFDHPRVPDTHPQLKRHVLYQMTKRDYGQTEFAP